MTPFRSIVMLAAAACGVFFALFVGHAIASHENIWYAYGLALLVLAAVFVVLQARLARDPAGHGH